MPWEDFGFVSSDAADPAASAPVLLRLSTNQIKSLPEKKVKMLEMILMTSFPSLRKAVNTLFLFSILNAVSY